MVVLILPQWWWWAGVGIAVLGHGGGGHPHSGVFQAGRGAVEAVVVTARP